MSTPTTQIEDEDDKLVPFVLEDYVKNPIALVRMKAHLTKKQLAERMDVTTAYIDKIERQDKTPSALLERVGIATQNMK